MMSAIVLAAGGRDVPDRVREWATRSLAWLVPAVVAGVVRDVVAACPTTWPVGDVMDHAGCALVAEDEEGERIARAAAVAKCERVLFVRFGFQPEGPLASEIDAFVQRTDNGEAALLLRSPARLLERLFPDRAPAVGVLLERRTVVAGEATLAALVRSNRGAARLRTRMVPVM